MAANVCRLAQGSSVLVQEKGREGPTFSRPGKGARGTPAPALHVTSPMREIVEDVLLKSAYSQVLQVPSFALIVHQLPLLTDLRDELAQTPSRHHRLPLSPQHCGPRRVAPIITRRVPPRAEPRVWYSASPLSPSG